MEFVDIYPTVAQLAGLAPVSEPEGQSLAPTLQGEEERIKKDVAFSCFPRGARLGVSMRTEQYRFTEWRNHKTNEVEYELYDHATDPGENQNLANLAAYDSIKNQLIKQLEESRPDRLKDGSPSPLDR